MPLTRTRTPFTEQHASWTRSSSRRFMAFAVIAAVATFGAVAAAAELARIDGAANVGEVAERIVPESGLLPFPIDPDPVCEVFNNFGGFSKYLGGNGHQGVDIGTDHRQEVYAVETGVLYREFSGSGSGLGWGLWGDSDTKYRYYHLDELEPGLAVGDRVEVGALIGYVGDTGNASPGGWHLHFEIRPGPDPHKTPVDPVPLIEIPDVCNVY